MLDSDIAGGRVVREISFDQKLEFGRFDAFDFFGDGSFYLLDAPGHAVGHICAVARTTTSPSSFVFMGADACHHPGALRPTEYLPLPTSPPIPPPPSSNTTNLGTCPGSLLQRLTIAQSATKPFFTVAQGPLFPDHEAAMDTVQKIQQLDALDNVFVLIAHDLSLRDRIPLFPERINGWEERDLGGKTRWVFCGEFICNDAFES